MINNRDAQIVRDQQMKDDWLLMTGQNMGSRELNRLKGDYIEVHDAYLGPSDFERLKNNWLMLTGSMNSIDFEKLKRNYLVLNWTRMSFTDFELLRRNWLLFSENIDPSELEKLKRDYLVLNWTKMNSQDFEQFKINWSFLCERLGTDNQENIIKGWLLNHAPYMEYRYMSNDDKVEYTRLCLERGADVNAVNRVGYSLLQNIVGYQLMMHAPLLDLVLSYGADVNIRSSDGKTPLDEARIYFYKDHEEIVSLLQTAMENARNNALSNNDDSQTPCNQAALNDDMRDNAKLEYKLKRDSTSRESSRLDEMILPERRDNAEIQKWWIQTYESPYLKRIIECFEYADLADIDNLLLCVINYMFISKVQRVYWKRFNEHGNITKTHQIYSKMCSKLYNVFDSQFNTNINITFPTTGKFCDNAELVSSIEIHPEVEWVALKIFALPSDIEYYILCVAGQKINFMLLRKYQDNSSICSQNLLCRYEKYLSPQNQRPC